ncbi:MAG: PadR family transcriptional regulator [Gemmatimonadota bacterium]
MRYCDETPRDRGRRRSQDPWGAWTGGAGFRKAFFRGGRVFDQGDLKYVILQLLAEKPRHGYEVIKALEEKFSGTYAPSAGAVYPTLTLLEDLGYAAVSVEEGGKKVYSITDEGRRYLDENRTTVDDLFERIAEFGTGFMSDGMRDVGKAFGRLAAAAFSPTSRYFHDKDLADRVRAVLERAAREIEDIARAPKRPDEAAPPPSNG